MTKNKLVSVEVVLGQEYRDKLTGFAGVATTRSTFLYGCVRVGLEKGHEGKVEIEFFDEQRLIEVETEQPVKTTATTGGARGEAPPRRIT